MFAFAIFCSLKPDAMKRHLFERNRALYRKLLFDADYLDVHIDIWSGGVSAVHKLHRFDQQKGPYGIKRGDYERVVVDILRRKGYTIILESERAAPGVKTPDGTLNGFVMDIKAVESAGRWAIKDKLHKATKQDVEVLILYFPKKELFVWSRIATGWSRYVEDLDSKRYPKTIQQVVCVIEEDVLVWDIKKELPKQFRF